MEKMERALRVITTDSRIRAFLEQNDPMALKQCLEALNGKTIEIPANQRRIEDLLCGAFEGGSNYWYLIERYEYPEGQTHESLKIQQGYIQLPFLGGRVIIKDIEGEDPKEYVLDKEACLRGLKVMAEKYPRHYADWMVENDDVITADVYLQCCLFGEIVYS